jgi:DNA polymerase/3'-5' exonuclease PolX
MSLGDRVPLARAMELAKRLSDELSPLLTRVRVAGSVRRQRPIVSDIEFVAEPLFTEDLFGGRSPQLEALKRKCAELGRVHKNGDRFIQVKEVLGTSQTMDLFLVHPPAEWGPILAIRTGPAELSQRAVTLMHGNGCRSENGRIISLRTGDVIPCPDEETFFRLAGLRHLPPRFRDSARAQAPIGVHA